MTSQELEKKFEELQISEDDLDDLVHEVASELASTANNQGFKGQIDFLVVVGGWTQDEILEHKLTFRG